MLDGGAGADQLYGDVAGCSVFCDSTPTGPCARRELDTVDCGGGADTAQVDQLDLVAFCDSVDRETVAQAGGGGGAVLAKASFARLQEDREGEPQGPLQLQLPRGTAD